MEMSSACLVPVQPHISDDLKSHPLANEYVQYQAACSAQLVTAATFESWIDMRDRAEKEKAGLLPYQIIERHPRGQEYFAYSRITHRANKTPVSFDEWLNGK